MADPGGTTPRLAIEQTARRAIEQIDRETTSYVAKIETLRREREEMERVLKALGVEFHWQEPTPSAERG